MRPKQFSVIACACFTLIAIANNNFCNCETEDEKLSELHVLGRKCRWMLICACAREKKRPFFFFFSFFFPAANYQRRRRGSDSRPGPQGPPTMSCDQGDDEYGRPYFPEPASPPAPQPKGLQRRRQAGSGGGAKGGNPGTLVQATLQLPACVTVNECSLPDQCQGMGVLHVRTCTCNKT